MAKNPDALAREHAAEAIGVLHDIMVDPLSEVKDRIRAAETLLERGHGKAVSAVISVPLAKRQASEMAAMTDEQLMEAIREQPLPRLVQKAVEPEWFTCPYLRCPGDHENELDLCPDVASDDDLLG